MNRFDKIAPEFDTDKRKKRALAVATELRRHITADNKSAIEFGCGTGLLGLELCDCFKKLIFVDSSAGMIEQVNIKLAQLNNPALSAVCCDLMQEIPEGLDADCVFCSLVLHHIVDTGKVLQAFFNLLNTHGRLLIVDLNPDDGGFHAGDLRFIGHHGYEQKQLLRDGANAGFASCTVHTFYNDTKSVNGVEKPYSLFVLIADKGTSD